MAIHFIDTETTGLDASVHEIIEIAIITENGDGDIKRWCTKIKPQRIEDADPKALEVNGYNEEDWRDAPTFEEVYEHCLWDKWDNEDIMVGHNIAFDAEFLREECRRIGEWQTDQYFPRTKIDTITLAHEHLMPMGLLSLSMGSIRSFLDWSYEGAHTALKDAEDCRKLYWCLLRRQNYNQVIKEKDLTAPENAAERIRGLLDLIEPSPRTKASIEFLTQRLEKHDKYGEKAMWSDKQKAWFLGLAEEYGV